MKSLNAAAYCDAKSFEHEREKIFKNAWHYAGNANELSETGAFITQNILGVPVIVLRETTEKLRAFVNVCPHRGAEICLKAKGTTPTLMCHYHAWTWRLDGHLLRIPMSQGELQLNQDDCNLQELLLQQLGPFIFICLDKTPKVPWEKLIGELPQIIKERGVDFTKLRYMGSKSYEMNCNWKIVVENFLECYHCGICHPQFSKIIDLKHYTVTPYEYFSVQRGPLCCSKCTTTAENLAEDQFGIYNYLWPLFMVNTYPGIGNASTNIIRPISAQKTLVTYEFYADPAMNETEMQNLIDLIDQVQKEDVVICESVQRGLESGRFAGGHLIMAKENGIKHFRELIQKSLL